MDKISFAFSAQPTLRVFPQKPLAGSQTFWLCGQLQGGLEVFSNTFQYEKDSATGGGTRTPGPKQPCDIAITAPAMIFKLIFKKSRSRHVVTELTGCLLVPTCIPSGVLEMWCNEGDLGSSILLCQLEP